MKRSVLALILGAALMNGACGTWTGAQHYQRGTAALESGNHAEAARALEAAAIARPDASEIQNHLGLAYAGLGRDADALAAFRRAVDLDCDNQPAKHNLALAEARAADASAARASSAP